MNIDWLEWLGYLASLLVLISLLMSSILKLRWINLIGSALFSLYGFLLGALPVGLMNLGIVIINIYYLVKIYGARAKKEYFKILSTQNDSEYFAHFIHFYQSELQQLADPAQLKSKTHDVNFFILRNMVPAGLFLGSKQDDQTLVIELDFVIPEYRDFKIGNFLYEENKNYFIERGYTRLIYFSSNNEHVVYLRKMGFEEKEENGKKYFEKVLKQ